MRFALNGSKSERNGAVNPIAMCTNSVGIARLGIGDPVVVGIDIGSYGTAQAGRGSFTR